MSARAHQHAFTGSVHDSAHAGGEAFPSSRQWPFITLASVITIGCWATTIYGIRWMGPSMPMPGGWHMSSAWMPMGNQSPLQAALMFLVMWEAMMVAMMLPSALPMVLLFRRVMAMRRVQQRPHTSAVFFICGYFVVWLAFGAVAYLLGKMAVAASMHWVRVAMLIPAALGVVLAVAGAWQLSGWKLRCLSHCQGTFGFIAHGWREGRSGALLMGVHHGAYCAACCWALMAIQLSVGVMNLPLMVAIALVILFEKVWKHGAQLARWTGAAAMVVGVAMLASQF